jgi:alpha-L-rhamnosidase
VDGKLTLVGHITETCQYYAFFFGVADKVTHRALWERLRDEFGPERDATVSYPEIAPSNMIIGVYMRQDLLMEDGDIARMYREECHVFYSMAKRTGTLWEHLSVKNSLCHGFASYCAKWIVYMLTGYRGVEDGCAVFENRNLGVDCEIALPFGEDYLRVTVKDGALSVEGGHPYKIL